MHKPLPAVLRQSRSPHIPGGGYSHKDTLAKKLSEDVTPEEKGTSADVKPAHQGMVMSCLFCGEAYIRTANRAVTCGKPECHRARKAMNKRNSRKKQKIAALKSNPAGKAEE